MALIWLAILAAAGYPLYAVVAGVMKLVVVAAGIAAAIWIVGRARRSRV